MGGDAECDIKSTEAGWYCAGCDAVLEKSSLDKEGKCKACKQAPQSVTLCVKKYFVASCCKTRHASPGKC
jgi:hypothetical protein